MDRFTIDEETLARLRVLLRRDLSAVDKILDTLPPAPAAGDGVVISREQLADYYCMLSRKPYHASDCATSCAPAEIPGPCDCDAPAAGEAVAEVVAQEAVPCLLIPGCRLEWAPGTSLKIGTKLYAAPPPTHQADVAGLLALIGQERQRQISECGWTLEHDDTHVAGEIATAAADYALPGQSPVPGSWAFGKALDPRERQLIIAAALCVAEIERLRRAALRGAGG